MKQKVFGIGLSKTGTSSLAAALEFLGYRTRDYPGLSRYVPGDLSSIDPQMLDQHDALTDTPIPSFYRELDARYPCARFILTVRSMDGWLLSCKKQFSVKLAEKQNEAHNRLFTDLYGTTVYDEALFRAGYQRFVDGVLAHFKGRPQDLLVLDVAGGDGWDKLCGFLGRPVPQIPFPKANVTRIRWMDLQELVSIVREAGEELLRAHRGLLPAESGSPGLPSLVRKTVYSLRGGRQFALEAAAAAAQKVMVRRLSRLNPEIPVIVRGSPDAPRAEQLHWNHYWIIDPLDGDTGLGTTEGEFTVNLALIEDGKPIAGVVHAPLSNTTWYAMVGKGAFRKVGDSSASSLGSDTVAVDAPSHAPPSLALRLCRGIEHRRGDVLAGAMAWHSAAPHAMARIVGRRIVETDGGAELAYHRSAWVHPSVRVV